MIFLKINHYENIVIRPELLDNTLVLCDVTATIETISLHWAYPRYEQESLES